MIIRGSGRFHQARSIPTAGGGGGSFAHNGSFTITGSGFGSKSPAAPTVYDDATGANIGDLWSTAWPDIGLNSTGGMDYRSAQRGVAMPHAHVSKYLCGAVNHANGANDGYFIALGQDLTGVTGLPKYIYVNLYYRKDPAWVFGLGSPSDDNHKNFDWSEGTGGIYSNHGNHYWEYADGSFTSSSDTPEWHINDANNETSSLTNNGGFTDANGHSWYWDAAVNPTSGWIKQEVEFRIDSSTSGYIKIYENGVKVVNYAGLTDNYASFGNTRNFLIGGYRRSYPNSNNWDYFAGVTFDFGATALARVILTNNATYASSTVFEHQPATSWSGTSIGITPKFGPMSSGQTGYLWVFDSSGTRQSAGSVLLA